MESYDLCISTATLHFSELKWSYASNCYCFDIEFKSPAIPRLDKICNNAGVGKDQAQNYLNFVKNYLEKAELFQDYQVNILFSDCHILAIGAKGKDWWIDIRNGLSCYGEPNPLSFSSLGININSLKVY